MAPVCHVRRVDQRFLSKHTHRPLCKEAAVRGAIAMAAVVFVGIKLNLKGLGTVSAGL